MTNSTRQLSLFFVVLLIAAFVLNWLWEMAQMSGYVEMSKQSWRASVPVCTVATVGDVAITISIYGIGALASGRLRWGLEKKWNIYATAAVLGGAWAMAIEWRAIAFGRWTYSDRMPVMPFLGVGLWPLLQLTLLVPAAFWIAACSSLRSRSS